MDADIGELAALYYAPPFFDLHSHCASVFEGQLFTKACIATTYACLCQELHVPRAVLADALRMRCEHTAIEVSLESKNI